MPLIRQTPQFSGIFNNIQFIENKDIESCDYWVVYDDLRSAEEVLCPPDNTILITGEPPCIKTYDNLFINQFSKIITSHRNLVHPNIINYQPGLPWHIGRKIVNSEINEYPLNYDELSSLEFFDKEKLISTIVSNKTITKDQKQRVKFIEKFEKYSNFDLDVFGTGRNFINDKRDAIAPYKYHLAFENCAVSDYFSEKLSDAYLGGAYPFYYGCTNIDRYFSPDAYTQISIYNIKESIEIIEEKIKNNSYEKSVDAIRVARQLTLSKYNLFGIISNCIKSDKAHALLPKQKITIYPQNHYHKYNLIKKIRRLFRI